MTIVFQQPTNHLDITAKEVLEEALLHFGGAAVIVSHDRYFLSQVCNAIYEIYDKTVYQYDCDYYDYVHSLDESESSLRENINARIVSGDRFVISHAKESKYVDTRIAERNKNFGGSGVTCGNPFKGIKNAKRFMKR